MSRWSIAEWRGPVPNQGGTMVEQRGLVVHIAEGTYEGTIAWQRNPTAGVSSHFVVAVDGTIAQCVDSDRVAWTQRDGNGHWLSVENAGHTPNPLTPQQVDANARLMVYGHQLYGYPLTLAGSPSGRGLGYHSMGAENGANWGHPDCPGPAIKAQLPAILARAVQIARGGDDDMEIFYRATENGAVGLIAGNTYRGFATMDSLAKNLKLRGKTTKDLVPIALADLPLYGTDVTAGPVVTLTEDQLAQLARDIAAEVDVPTTAEIADAVNDNAAARLAG